jgi:hypothetical protein
MRLVLKFSLCKKSILHSCCVCLVSIVILEINFIIICYLVVFVCVETGKGSYKSKNFPDITLHYLYFVRTSI